MRRQGRVRQVKAFGAEWSYVYYRSRLIKYVHMAEAVMREVERLGGRPKLLDVGSGKGRLTWYCRAPRKWNSQPVSRYSRTRTVSRDPFREESFSKIDWYGVDVDFKRMRQARDTGHYIMAMGNLDVGLPYADGTFDIVVASHVLEHIDKPETGIRELHRVLKPGGMIVVGVPIYDPVLRLIRLAIGPLMDGYFRLRKGQAVGHHTIFTLGSLRRLMRDFGMEEVRGFRMGRGQLLIFLEDSRLLYDLNTWWGSVFPALSPEVNVVGRKQPGLSSLP
jgi:SAM-dependent methyltransferase